MATTNQVRIALTFDDGPHTASSASNNFTLAINKALMDRKIVAAFFIQAQVDIRMGSRTGKDIIRTLYTSGHSIQIHTGSKKDHAFYYDRVRATDFKDFSDSNGDGKFNKLDGVNALQSDMKYAKKAISEAIRQTKGNPEYVPHYARAPTGALYRRSDSPQETAATQKKIISTLKQEGLSNVLWNVDSRDNSDPRPSPKEVYKFIDSDINIALKNKNQSYIIVLFHDINGITADNVGGYISKITESVKKHGRVPVYTSSRREVDSVLEQHKTVDQK